ncbi:non-canonical purine NTP pyrophosphatase, RdgB/HAM1 family [Halothiobacillus diazotrophicus]|uniref:dITP/XTP pyrophosphatase n=2 Tax=Halothiobacillus diazotrophicus TaxID=1860122 RepID=A0A191ZHS2_9GAMM|nr:non-canonical purine NTP pyrophosphatase, RdgB/HAM1 family [Halothiobacillus diazotrophicus]
MTQIVIATHNRGKLREFEAMRVALSTAFPGLSRIQFLPLSDWQGTPPDEDGERFIDNALIKARAAAALTGLPALADDSGLVVDALNGAPGVYSARYAGVGATDAENNLKLQQALAGTPESQRSARYVCALALVRHAEDAHPLTAEGEWPGSMLTDPRGTEGFGYDPFFFSPEHGQTAAQMPAELKNSISHRARALTKLLTLLGHAPL